MSTRGRHRPAKSKVWRQRHNITSAKLPQERDRPKVADTVIMALVAITFIAVFGYALSRHVRSDASSVAQSEPATSTRVELPADASPTEFACANPVVIDGDTLRCREIRVRLASIDAPEMPGHCRSGRDCVSGDPVASKTNLERLITGGPVQCRQTDIDHYDRIVALCSVDRRDLSCSQVSGGFAVIRYGALECPAA